MRTMRIAVVTLMAVFAGLWLVRAATLTVPIVVSPNTLNLESEGVWVTVHAEISYGRVDGISVTLNGIPVEVTKADNRGELVAKFNLDDVKAILEPGVAELTLSGLTYDGIEFTGTDAIQVIRSTGKP